MTKIDFLVTYNPDCRCIATFRNAEGYRVQGLVLDTVQLSATGKQFLYVDSFSNRVGLDQVESIRNTGTPWVVEASASGNLVQ